MTPRSPLLPRALARAGWRWQLAHPGQALLAITGVAVGVAAVVAIELANASAAVAFTRSVDSLAGIATHAIVGGPTGVPEALVATLRTDQETAPLAAAASIEHPVVARGSRGAARILTLLGIDPLADSGVRPVLGGGRIRGAPLGQLLARPGTVALSTHTAGVLDLAPGDTLTIDVDGTPHVATLTTTIDVRDPLARAFADDRVVCDLASAQELTGRLGSVDRIDLVAPADDARATAALERARARLPPGAAIEPARARGTQADAMVRAFRMNLAAMSMLALLVGAFLVYNAASFSVVRRREQFGQLRALGTTRGQVLALVLAEALVLGALGSALGALVGIELARALLGLVTSAITDLYFVLATTELEVHAGVLARGVAVGMAASALAALVPALEAAATPPRLAQARSVVEDRARTLALWLAVLGVALVGLSVPALGAASHSLGLAFLGLALRVAGGALCAPAFLRAFVRVLTPSLGWVAGPLGRAAARGVDAALSRTAVATASLSLALSVVIGVGTMVGSFRLAIERWLTATLGADLYVSPPSLVARKSTGTMDPQLARAITEYPGARRGTSIRRVIVRGTHGPVQLAALEVAEPDQLRVEILSGSLDQAWRSFLGGELLVSEPFAYHHGLAAGDTLDLETDQGRNTFRICAITRDYASDEGIVTVHRATYEGFWRDRARSGVSLDLRPGASAADAKRAIEALAVGRQLLIVRTNRELLDASLAIFERTFRVTDALALIAALVALVGAIASLLALELERAHERAILRALGATPGQVAALVAMQAGVVGLAAGLLSIPLGLAMAEALTGAINRRSFGWSFALAVDPLILARAVALALAAAAVASLAPAILAARRTPHEALRRAFG